MKQIFMYASVFLLIMAIVAIAVLFSELSKETEQQSQSVPTQETGEGSVAGIEYNPPSIEEVPDGPKKEAILRGHELINDTSQVLRSEAASVEDGERAVNALSCTSCHAGAGLDENSSSLVGMTAVYPEYISRSDQIVTIEERINGCMVRSMNGEPFAEDDEDLDAMVTYLQYISTGIPVNADLPWRKTNVMENVPIPDVAAGEALFQQSCIACHAQDGSGTGSNTGPAVWGEGSFNDGAGLARMSNMAGYIQNNMPKGNEESLDDQQAADLAAFILSQDRPEFDRHDGDWPGGGSPSDSMTKELRDQVKDGTINWEEVLGTDQP